MSPIYRWHEANCETCGTFLHVREDMQPPHYCVKHEGGKTMSRRKKKDFSEAVEASAEVNGNGAKTVADRERIERKRYSEKLPCAIEPEMVALQADEMAKTFRQREALVEERRAVMADFRDKFAHIDEKLAELATAVEQHTVVRDVEVIEYLIQGTGSLEVVRQDTMEVVEVKAASGDDLQETIFGKEPPKPPRASELDDEDGDADEGEPETGTKWTHGANPKPVETAP